MTRLTGAVFTLAVVVAGCSGQTAPTPTPPASASPAPSLSPTVTATPSASPSMPPSLTPSASRSPVPSALGGGPPPCGDASLVYDQTGQRTLLVTCVDQLNGQDSEEIWAWDGSVWELIDDQGPPPLVVTGVTWDPAREVLVRYGGLPLDSNQCDATTWEWQTSTGWYSAPALDSDLPMACDHLKLAYDAWNGETVLFGGGRLQELSAETWTWVLHRWRLLAETGPAPRAHHELVYDVVSQQVVLFGGYDGTQVFDDFWSWDVDLWTDMTPETSPGPRSHGAMAASPDGLMLFGGATGTSTFATLTDETWLLTDGAWTNLDVDGPSARASAALAHDPDRDVFVLYGGFSPAGTELGDTWEFDGDAWSCVDGC